MEKRNIEVYWRNIFKTNRYKYSIKQTRKTNMKNLADDIVDLINFIRVPEDPLLRDKVFTSEKNHEMAFKPGGIEYLKKMTAGYVSYLRGADPLTFAKRIDKGIIHSGLLFTKT